MLIGRIPRPVGVRGGRDAIQGGGRRTGGGAERGFNEGLFHDSLGDEDLLQNAGQLLGVQAGEAVARRELRHEGLGLVPHRGDEDQVGLDVRLALHHPAEPGWAHPVALEVRVADHEHEVLRALVLCNGVNGALHRTHSVVPGPAVLGMGVHLVNHLQAFIFVRRGLRALHQRDLDLVPRVARDAVEQLVLKTVKRLHDHHSDLRRAVQPSVHPVEAVHAGADVQHKEQPLLLVLSVPALSVGVLPAALEDRLLAGKALDQLVLVPHSVGLVPQPRPLLRLGLQAFEHLLNDGDLLANIVVELHVQRVFVLAHVDLAEALRQGLLPHRPGLCLDLLRDVGLVLIRNLVHLVSSIQAVGPDPSAQPGSVRAPGPSGPLVPPDVGGVLRVLLAVLQLPRGRWRVHGVRELRTQVQLLQNLRGVGQVNSIFLEEGCDHGVRVAVMDIEVKHVAERELQAIRRVLLQVLNHVDHFTERVGVRQHALLHQLAQPSEGVDHKVDRRSGHVGAVAAQHLPDRPHVGVVNRVA
eukprot:RCo015880